MGVFSVRLLTRSHRTGETKKTTPQSSHCQSIDGLSRLVLWIFPDILLTIKAKVPYSLSLSKQFHIQVRTTGGLTDEEIDGVFCSSLPSFFGCTMA
jgi:hypothetical protein